jgi:hypothetical protein
MPSLRLLISNCWPLTSGVSLSKKVFLVSGWSRIRIPAMCTLAGWLVLGVQAGDPLKRFVVSPQAVNTTIGYENVGQRHPFRVVNGETVDLRPLFAWINRGKTSRGAKPFDQPSPLRDWRPVDGTIVAVTDDAVLVAKGISKALVFVKNLPPELRLAKGAPVSVVAVEAGQFEHKDVSGLKQVVPIFDHGVPAAPPANLPTNIVVKPGLPANLPPPKTPTGNKSK